MKEPKTKKKKASPYASPPYVCTQCGHQTVRTECPWHGREFIRTRDKEEDEK